MFLCGDGCVFDSCRNDYFLDGGGMIIFRMVVFSDRMDEFFLGISQNIS
jgi:hypothetical protein